MAARIEMLNTVALTADLPALGLTVGEVGTGHEYDDSPWTRDELQALAWERVKHDDWSEYDRTSVNS